MTPAPADLPGRIARHFACDPPGRLGVAVSGGGDSTALLMLLADWGGAELHVVTVDHRLRPEAAEEIALVARLCARLGLPHDVLRWDGWDGCGNLMAAARAARYRLMAGWAQARGIGDIALGHTQDDLAETFVMRLRRGAGLDGLSAMAARLTRDGILFHRPLLSAPRSELRGLLEARGIGWSEDATNDDMRFERAQVRAALATLGLDTEALAETAQALRLARDALEAATAEAADICVTPDRGDLLIARKGLEAQPPEIARRIVLRALHHVSGAGYGPRGAELSRLMEAAMTGLDRPRTLLGCRIIPHRDVLRITREWRAVAGLRAAPGAPWDGRWLVEGPAAGRHVAALGEAALRLCPARKESGLPAASLIASPAVWEGAQLVAAPLAGFGHGYRARLLRRWPAPSGVAS